MELLLALDFITIPGAIELLKEVGDGIDIVEIGTPLIVKEGLTAVEQVRTAFPGLTIMADLKIMDAGEYECRMAFAAGADLVTVLGVADDATIKASVAEAAKHGKFIMADMIGVADIRKRATEIDELGVDYICVHVAVDLQQTGKNPLEELQIVKSVVTKTKTAVAGGIKLSMIDGIVKENPAIIIVGGGITGQRDKRAAALEMKKRMGRGCQ